jgi:hypothetical protein
MDGPARAQRLNHYYAGFFRRNVNQILNPAANAVAILATPERKALLSAINFTKAAPPRLIKANHPPVV